MRRFVPKSSFVRRAVMLSGGTFAGQLVLAASSPILTRLYSPEAFGALAIFMSLTAMLGTVAALRYEFAIPVTREPEEAADLVGLCFAAVLLTTGLASLVAGLLGPWLARATETPGLTPLLWFLPISVASYGISLPLTYWSVRQGTFRVNTANKLIQASSQSALQLGMGLARTGTPGLIAGYALGMVATPVHFLGKLSAAERRRLLVVPWRRMLPLARRHWQYPVYSAPSSLLQSSTQFLPALALAALYGPALAGWFGLGQRIMGLPVKLLAQAASQAFLGEVPRLGDDAQVRRLFLRSVAGFALVGFLGMAPVLLLGPALFAFVFGEAWREAGIMAAILMPQHLARFVVTPVSQTLNIYGRQELHLVASLANAASLAAAFGLGWAAELGALKTIGLYSLGTTLAYVLYLGLAWRVVRKGGIPPARRPDGFASAAAVVEA